MQALMKKIEKADGAELYQIIHAVIRRYAVLYPDWEVVFYSMHRHGALRISDLSELIHMLTKELDAKKDSLG